MRSIWMVRGMLERSRWRHVVLLMLAVFVAGVVYLGYLCPDRLCKSALPSQPASSHVVSSSALRSPPLLSGEATLLDDVATFLPSSFNFDLPQDIDRRFQFDDEHDVLVFLHMQKTGGSTFGRHLVRDAVGVPAPCTCHMKKKRCDCVNKYGWQWLFSRYSTGWACGLHADWTELHDCVPQVLDEREGKRRLRRYLYFTVLRDPIQRYLSEWKHVQRGSTWQSAKLMCNGRQATLSEVPFCFRGADWTGVTLDEFMSCPHNLANNRQTRMLANLTLVGCYDRSFIPDPRQRDAILLQSAINNLHQMAYFGLTEYQEESRYLFEQTIGFRFERDFVQFNETHALKAEITEEQLQSIKSLNRLDIVLYVYARKLFFERLKRAQLLQSVSATNNEAMRVTRMQTSYQDTDNYNGDDDVEDDDEQADMKPHIIS